MRICARSGCNRLLVRGFSRYCKYQQPSLDTSEICTCLFPKGQKCGLFQKIICARPGCVISIARKDFLNNQTLIPLHSEPLYLPTDRGLLCARQEFTGFGQISSLNNQSLTPLYSAPFCFPINRTVVCARQELARYQGVGYKSCARILSIYQVSTISPRTL